MPRDRKNNVSFSDPEFEEFGERNIVLTPRESRSVLEFLNSAERDELARAVSSTEKPNIDLADMILEARRDRGGFKDLGQVLAVPAVEPATFEAVADSVRASGATPREGVWPVFHPITWKWAVPETRACNPQDPHNWDEVYRLIDWKRVFGSAYADPEWTEGESVTFSKKSEIKSVTQVMTWVQGKVKAQVSKSVGIPFGASAKFSFEVEAGAAKKWLDEEIESEIFASTLVLHERSRKHHWERFVKMALAIVEVNRCCLGPGVDRKDITEWASSFANLNVGGSAEQFCEMITAQNPECLRCRTEPMPNREDVPRENRDRTVSSARR